MMYQNLKIFLVTLSVVIFCFTSAAATEKSAEEEIPTIKRNKGFMQSSSVKSRKKFSIAIDNDNTSNASSLRRRLLVPLNDFKTRADYPVSLTLDLPEDIMVEVASFLGRFDQLRLSHTNAKLKNIVLGENFWEKEIRKQKYILWDDSLPKVKAFFANYFYEKGFGRHPLLSVRKNC
ncbi:MAG: F-box protein [Alphaproteobacteria bacterium]|nr:F-box protein [Alphaproteobacteria bacterium]